MDLKAPIKDGEKVFKMYSRRLAKLGIFTFADFLYHIPNRYDDYSLISDIGKVQVGETVTIQGKVLEIKNRYTRRFKTLQKAKVEDATGIIDILWFNQPFLAKSINAGDLISLSGKVEQNLGKPIIKSPDYEILESENSDTIHTGRLVPVYPQTYGVSSKWLRRQIKKLLDENKNKLEEYMPIQILKSEDFLDLKTAIEQVHFPKNLENAVNAKKRLAFDELFLLQLSNLEKRKEWKEELSGRAFETQKFDKEIKNFYKSLPFELTNAQKRAIREIIADLSKDKPMNRLLEGDVGSGKTVVAAVAMYCAFLNGYQSVFMAPTEILANQHFETIKSLLTPFGVAVELHTGSKKLKIENLKLKIIIGTHALLHKKDIDGENLGLVIIDEQQRFGVEQRSIIRNKGKNPHFLTMTATPIPRTVALTLYGDLDLSVLDEMPLGRKLVKTWLVPPQKREGAYEWIEKEIKLKKTQAFIVCPFIEESESMQTVKAATVEFEKLKKHIFSSLKLGLLHGRMPAHKGRGLASGGKSKDEVLDKFRAGKIDILVATPVVEVGIDIPNATIILIEAAERFGLAQLHQLRGRVGRTDTQSYCLLFTESKSEKTIERLKSLETIYIGAELAEMDLKLRGAGDIYGTLQHGEVSLKVASFSDFALIEKAKKYAQAFLPSLNKYPKLLEKLKDISAKQISPD